MASIRNAREDEAMELAAIGMRAWESAVTGWIDIGLLRRNAERAFLSFTVHNFLTIDVAEQGGQAAAWAARERLDNHISDLWVDPIWQSQGFGKLLLARLESEIEGQGYEVATIETHSQNEKAIEFLRHHGYEISWMTASWSPQLDRDVDTVGLVKRLQPAETQRVYSEF
jgi:ribosomal-protein-alanine N-acetyltransferase